MVMVSSISFPIRHVATGLCFFLTLTTVVESFMEHAAVHGQHHKVINAQSSAPARISRLFASSNEDQQHTSGSGFGLTSASPKKSKKPQVAKPNLAEFEMQELRAQLDEMAKRNLGSANLSLEKRLELEGYVRAVCERAPSPIPLDTLAYPPNVDLLKGIWRLGFSTEEATLNVLPKEARVFVNIMTTPNWETGKEGKLDYILRFSKGALREITAKSTYRVDVSELF